MNGEGVWIALHFDFSGFAVFKAEEELAARRYADEHNMSVHFVTFGQDVRQQILRPTVKRWVVEYTPGPPAIGVHTEKVVEADTAEQAELIIKSNHQWAMVHKVQQIIR